MKLLEYLKSRFNDSNANRTMAFLTGVIAITSIVTNLTTCEQIKDSNKATQETFERQDKSFEIENRAFVSFIGIGSEYRFQVDKIVNVPGIVQNLGHTPAYMYSSAHMIFCSAAALNRYLDTNTLDSSALKSVRVNIGANMTYVLSAHSNTPLSLKDSSLINSDGLNLYFIGCVIYIDIFNKKHYTHICGKVDMLTKSFINVGKYNNSN